MPGGIRVLIIKMDTRHKSEIVRRTRERFEKAKGLDSSVFVEIPKED